MCLICPRRICAGLFVRNFMEINRGEILSLWERRSQAERPSHLKQWRAKLTFLFSRRTIAIDHVYIDVDTIASRAGQRHDHRPHPVAFFLLSTPSSSLKRGSKRARSASTVERATPLSYLSTLRYDPYDNKYHRGLVKPQHTIATHTIATTACHTPTQACLEPSCRRPPALQ